MTTTHTVRRVQHYTGSLYRGLPQAIDRTAVAAALRTARRLIGEWVDAGTACRMLVEYRHAAPRQDYGRPSHSGELTHCARKHA